MPKTDKWIWEGPGDDEDISYLKEMVTHQASIGAVLSSVAAGALLSIPLGLGVGAIPILVAVAGEAIAALFVPSSPVFRAAVNRKKRRARRSKARAHLIEQLEARTNKGDPHWRTYDRMNERIDSLKALAENRATALTDPMVEQLQDASVDYLSLWVALLTMRERYNSIDERQLTSRLGRIEHELERAEDAVQRKHLEKAFSDLDGVLQRRKNLWGRAAGVEAAMLKMSDSFEEVYQRVVANPNSGNVAADLHDAVERMRVEEALDFDVDQELEGVLKKAAGRRQARTAQ